MSGAVSRRLLAPESTLPAPADWVAAWTRAAARDPGFTGAFAWSPWARLDDAAAWDWFRAALGLAGDLEGTFEDCSKVAPALRGLWARAGLFPGVCRIVVGADGLVDPDALIHAPDDWPEAVRAGAGRVLAGSPAIALPRLRAASGLCWDPGALEAQSVVYLLAGGRTAEWPLDAATPPYIGRAPELALAAGAAWRMYATPAGWLSAALAGRDGFDPDAPHDRPGGGAVTDFDRFIERYGEELIVDCGADGALALQYERRRKRLLRPNRPPLPEIRRRRAARPDAERTAA